MWNGKGRGVKVEVEQWNDGASLGDVEALRWCLEASACQGKELPGHPYRIARSAPNVHCRNQNRAILTDVSWLPSVSLLAFLTTTYECMHSWQSYGGPL